jgi:hypothetical protein
MSNYNILWFCLVLVDFRCSPHYYQEVYSPLGSELATKTLDQYGIKYYLIKIVPYIQNSDGQDICPMEKLSLVKAMLMHALSFL